MSSRPMSMPMVQEGKTPHPILSKIKNPQLHIVEALKLTLYAELIEKKSQSSIEREENFNHGSLDDMDDIRNKGYEEE